MQLRSSTGKLCWSSQAAGQPGCSRGNSTSVAVFLSPLHTNSTTQHFYCSVHTLDQKLIQTDRYKDVHYIVHHSKIETKNAHQWVSTQMANGVFVHQKTIQPSIR